MQNIFAIGKTCLGHEQADNVKCDKGVDNEKVEMSDRAKVEWKTKSKLDDINEILRKIQNIKNQHQRHLLNCFNSSDSTGSQDLKLHGKKGKNDPLIREAIK